MGVYENGEMYYETYVPQKGEPWGAESAWRRQAGRDVYNQWVLCYENRVVILHTSWELTETQMKTVGEKLGN